ncbi:hypothetical protein H5T88_03280 [bacterium]|nr:hypothetical protein [bacterium]
MRRNLFYLILLFLLVLLFFYKIFAGNVLLPADLSLRIQPWRSYSHSLFPDFQKVYNPLLDVTLYFYPWRVLLEQSLRAGFIPLWSSYNFCGQPFLANMASACLYPFNWPLLFLSAHILMTINIILHFLLTSIFTYFFLLSLGVRKISALLGAIIWTFSGPMVAWAEYQTPIASMCWLPLSLLLFQLFLKKGNFLFAVLSSLPLALSLLAGHTQFALYGWFTFFCFACFRIFSEKRYKSGFLALFISLLLGFLLSSPQLLPSFELSARSHRSLGTSFSDLLATAMPLDHLYTFLVPDFYGNPVDYDYRGAFNYVELCGYFGILPFFLLPFALKKRKESIFFLSLSFLAILFALRTPLLKIFIYLPVFKFLAAPARDLYIVSFSFAVLSALGMDNLPEKKSRLPLLILFILLLLFALGLSQKGVEIGFPSLRATLSFLFISILSLVLLNLKKEHALVALAIVDMFAFSMRFNPATSPKMLFPSVPIAEQLKSISEKGRFLALPGARDPLDTLLPNCNILLNLREVQGGDSLYPLRSLLFVQQINQTDERSNALYVKNPSSPLIDLMGVRFIFSSKDRSIKENENSLPLFYLVGETINVRNIREAIEKLHLASKEKAVLEGGERLEGRKLEYSIRILEERSGKLRLYVKSNEKAYLIISETFYPGWRGFVDGKEEEIVPANLLFKALLLPKGEHEVLLCYRPFSYKVGLYLSLFALSFIVSSLLFKVRGKKDKPLKGKL